jgi:DNA-binding Xre family transcriptional regulator
MWHYFDIIMDMRVRLPELLKTSGLSVYAVAKKSGGRTSMPALYRLKHADGYATFFDAAMLEALCDVFDVKPGQLLELDSETKATAKPKPKRKRAARKAK